MEQLRMIHTFDQIPAYTLAEGFSIRFYKPDNGDEDVWIALCKNGLLEANDGIEQWKAAILDMVGLEPQRDTFFVCDSNGVPVATTTAFFMDNETPLIHMVAANPEVKGKGLGLSMTLYALHKLKSEMGDRKMLGRLRTDDWRLPAVLCYLRAGFQPVLFDVGMEERWRAICEKLNFHGVEMLDMAGNPTGIIL